MPNIALVDDFNGTSPQWRASDKYNSAGRMIEKTVLSLRLHQLVASPTHLHSKFAESLASAVTQHEGHPERRSMI